MFRLFSKHNKTSVQMFKISVTLQTVNTLHLHGTDCLMVALKQDGLAVALSCVYTRRFCLALYYCELLLQGQFEQSYSTAYQYNVDEGLDLLLRYLYSKDNHNIYSALAKSFPSPSWCLFNFFDSTICLS